MKTEAIFKQRMVRLGGIGLCAVAMTLSATAQQLFPQKPSIDRPLLDNPLTDWGSDYTNWVEISAGNFWVNGSEAEFQRRHYMPDGFFGGLEDFHFEQRVLEKDTLSIDGRAMFGEEDYAVRLSYDRPGLGYVRGGYREFRSWYDRNGGYLPRFDAWTEPYERDVHLDRGEIWFETGLRLENVPEITFRYSHQWRDGRKDSTIWGDYNVNIGTTRPADRYNIVPAYRIIDEERNIFELDVAHKIAQTSFGVGVRYEDSGMENQLRYLRRPGEKPPLVTPGTERATTQREDMDMDLLNAHAFVEHRISPRALFTSGYAFTTLDTDLRGNRIVGEGFEAVYDPLFARRQPFDEGFLNLSGGGNIYQHTANLNLLLTPWDNFSILPGVRISAEKEDADSWFIETNVGQPPARAASQESLHAENDNDWLDVTEVLEFRYTGLTNWAFYVRGEWTQSDGNQTEYETAFGLTNTVRDLVQDVDQNRFIQKYTAGLNWYPLRRLNVGLQYYHKIRDSEYDPSSRMTESSEAYPGFLRDQDFETDDVNARLTLRPLNNLTLISRYDLQLSTIDTTAGELGETQTAQMTSHIFSQSISWAPISRLYVQLSGSYAFDETETPVDKLTGGAADLVRDSLNSYFNGSALVGIALDDRTDLQFQYFYYLADNDIDQGVVSVPYNSSAEEQGVTATLTRQLTAALRWTLKYGYYTANDDLFGGHKDYDAHLVYSSLQMRF